MTIVIPDEVIAAIRSEQFWSWVWLVVAIGVCVPVARILDNESEDGVEVVIRAFCVGMMWPLILPMAVLYGILCVVAWAILPRKKK